MRPCEKTCCISWMCCKKPRDQKQVIKKKQKIRNLCNAGVDYRVIVTNKRESAKSVVRFHHGRGSQEAIFGDAKNDAALDVIPTKRLIGNQLFTLCAMMAHNLSRELQMLASPVAERALPKRPAAWAFEKLDTLRHRLIQRAGRLTRPQGRLTLTLSANEAVRKDLLHFLDVLQKAA